MPPAAWRLREFPLRPGHGAADYLLYVDGRAAGVVEAKPEGHTLTGVEAQSGKYGAGLPDNLPSYVRPLPFLYESTGAETRFTNGMDPQPRSRSIFSFHTPGHAGRVAGRIRSLLGHRPATGFGHSGGLHRPVQLAATAERYAPAGRFRPVDGAGASYPQPGAVAGRGTPAFAGADGHRQRQNLHGLQPSLPPHPARRGPPGAVPR